MLDKYTDEIFKGYPFKEVLLRNLVPVDASETAALFYQGTRKSFFLWEKDFPTILSPWPFAWYEWNMPSWRREEREIVDQSNISGVKTGVLVMTIYDVGNEFGELATQISGMAPGVDIAQLSEKVGSAEAGTWFVSYTVFVKAKGQDLRKLGSIIDYLRPDGTPIIKRRSAFITDSQLAQLHLEKTSGEEGFSALILPLGFTLSLLHAKNVTTTERVPPERLQKARERRGKRPMVTYRTLEIEPMKEALRTEGKMEEVGLKKALHLCRGHFKDYREKGMFGRESHKGIYWWDMHVRGDANEGIVVKDYKVKAP